MPQGNNNKHRAQKIDIENRLQIIAPLYRRGWTEREITEEVRKRLDRPKYNQAHCDIQRLLKEWREERLTDTDEKITSEVARLKLVIREAWEAWEKSKEDYIRTMKKRKGIPSFGDEGGKTKTTAIETRESNVQGLGNVAYISEIRQQLQERRKLLGLYAPEKKEVSGELSFANMLVESGMLDDAERNSTEFDT